MFEEFKEFLKEFWVKFALLFLVFLIAGIGLGISIEDSLTPKTHTVSTMYIVKDGDTLIDICYEYQQLDCRKPYILEYVDEIKALNPNLPKYLQVGDKIFIRYLERE